ncbi:MAG: mcsB [Firmicutes bacterium]|nr:mcsB [Bacillota bacterium]
MAEGLIMTSRVRLARNLKRIMFPHKLSSEQGKKLVSEVEEAFYSDVFREGDYSTLKLWQTDKLSQTSYFEKRLISNNMINNSSKGAVILSNDDSESIMINEEDHIRIQCIKTGYNLEDAFRSANRIDDQLEKNLDFAFDEKYGYLTACPTNVGTGMRASVMIHLPFIATDNKVEESLYALSKLGMAIRGIYGEGSKVTGSIYQISNQITLGMTEQETLANLKAVINKIIIHETRAREVAYKNYKYEIEDRAARSLGILKSAVLLTSSECLKLLSDVRLGIEMGIIKTVSIGTVDALIMDVQPATIQKQVGKNLTKEEINLARAKLVKRKIRNKGR